MSGVTLANGVALMNPVRLLNWDPPDALKLRWNGSMAQSVAFSLLFRTVVQIFFYSRSFAFIHLISWCSKLATKTKAYQC